jgi:hypothetical protein
MKTKINKNKYYIFKIMGSILDMSEEEKKKIREKHDAIEKEAKQRKEDLKKGVAFKPKDKNENV